MVDSALGYGSSLSLPKVVDVVAAATPLAAAARPLFRLFSLFSSHSCNVRVINISVALILFCCFAVS